MPVLDPNPQNGQKKMLLVFGAFFAIFAIIAIVATAATPGEVGKPMVGLAPPSPRGRVSGSTGWITGWVDGREVRNFEV